jgi:hypothetical protein
MTLRQTDWHSMSNHSKPLSEFAYAAATPEEQAVLAPIQSLFDGVAKRDRKAMLDVLLPDGTTTIVINGRVFSVRSFGAGRSTAWWHPNH